MIKGHKVRIYPTKEQEQKMWRHIGTARWMYNFMLAEQIRRYQNGEKHMSAFDMNKYVTEIKKVPKYAWLSEIGSNTLYRACADVARAYENFFSKRSRFPRFKSRKHSKPNFPLRDSTGAVWFEESVVHLPSIGKVKYKTDLPISLGREVKLTNPRVSFVRNKWILSFGMECENQAPELTDVTMGIDLGVKDLAIAEFNGERIVYHNINKSSKMRRLHKKLRHLQRSISRKYEANKQGSAYVKTKNIEREEEKLRNIHAKIADIRQNYIHQTTHSLVSMRPRRVVMEDLNIKGMMRNRHMSRSIGEQAWGEFLRQMKYKCEGNGIEFVQANRFYPSSKTCSRCGCAHKGLKLKDRTFICPECGFTIDRDYQAALNLSRYAA